MSQPAVRIALIGAGAIYQSRHLPNIARLPGVELVAVANRSHESGRGVADQWGIPHVASDWRALIRREDVDAVFIGTWPYMHAEMSIAALAAGKHVFCQSRMAMDLAEARAMHDAARAHPHLVSMLCPPPHRMPFERAIRGLLDDGALGDLAAVSLTSVTDASLASDKLHWRENITYSGKQIMAVGICAEVLNAWVGPYESLSAAMSTTIAVKQDEHGRDVPVRVPQTVAVHGRLRAGVICSELHCGAAAGKPVGDWLHIHGTRASLRYRLMSSTIELAKPGQSFDPMPVPDGPATVDEAWTVERDFIAAVRSAMAGAPPQDRAVSPDFTEGLAYMKKIEALHLSANSGRLIDLATLDA
jgi:predicted dehydrogenase